VRGPTIRYRQLLRLSTLHAFHLREWRITQRVAELARSGDKDADAVLCGIASRLIAGSCTMPPILRDYIIDRLRRFSRSEHFLAKPGRRGRRARTNLHRNLAIVSAVSQLVDCGLRATRNDDGSERECACSIVADLLKGLGVKLSYHGVAKVWTERRRVGGCVR
jgi:hypothetical protein